MYVVESRKSEFLTVEKKVKPHNLYLYNTLSPEPLRQVKRVHRHCRDRRENTAVEIDQELRLRSRRVVPTPIESPCLWGIRSHKSWVSERTKDSGNLFHDEFKAIKLNRHTSRCLLEISISNKTSSFEKKVAGIIYNVIQSEKEGRGVCF